MRAQGARGYAHKKSGMLCAQEAPCCAHQVGQMGPVKVTPTKFRSGPKEQSPASPLLWLWSGGPWVPVLLRQRGGSAVCVCHAAARGTRVR